MPRTSLLCTTLAVACAALGTAGVPAASADRVVETYDVTYTGQGTYHKHDQFIDPHAKTDWTFDAAFSWTAKAEGVEVVDGRLPATLHPVADVTVQSARSDFRSVSDTDQVSVGSCTGSQPEPIGVGSFADWPIAEATRRYVFDPLEELIIPVTCSGVLAGGDFGMVFGNGTDLEGTIVVPPAAQGAGQVIEVVAKPDDAPCPQRTPRSIACDYDWSGQITMTRTSRRTVRDSQPTPPPPPGPVTPPPAPRTQGDIAVDVITRALEKQKASEDQLVKNVNDAVKEWLESDERIADSIQEVFMRETSKMNVELRCPSTCTGTVKAYSAPGPRSKGTGTPLATGTLRTTTSGPRAPAAGMKKARAQLRFSKAAGKRLARSKYVALRIELRAQGVPGVTRATNTVRVASKRR